MPFESESQRKFMWAKHPKIAKKWAHEYPESNKGLPEHVGDKDKKGSKKEANDMNPAEKVIDAITCAASSIEKLQKEAADKKASEDRYLARIPSIVDKCVQFGRIDNTPDEREKLAEWLATPEGALEVIDKLAEHKVEEKTAEALGEEVDTKGRPSNGRVKQASDGVAYTGGRRTSEKPESWKRMESVLGM